MVLLKVAAGVIFGFLLSIVANILSGYLTGTSRYRRFWISAGVFLVVLSIVVTLPLNDLFKDRLASICSSISTSNTEFSMGEQFLLPSDSPSRSREKKIYENNKDISENSSLLLAVAVPAKTRTEVAGAILAGVADAQTRFNLNQKDPTRTSPEAAKFLKILVVDDGNTKEGAKKVACQIAGEERWKNVVGIIGHHSSDATKSAVDAYAKVDLATISPTSTSTSLSQTNNGKVFFRATSSNRKLGSVLANYIRSLNLGKVIIFYDKGIEYSENAREEFIKSFDNDRVYPIPDNVENLRPPNYDVTSVSKYISNEVKGAIFFPSGGTDGTNDRAIQLMGVLKRKKPDLKFFAGVSLYEGRTLSLGKTSIQDLVLVVPWFPILRSDGSKPSPSYVKTSTDNWRGQINWRTASSFDATQAFLAAITRIQSQIDRGSVLKQLKTITLPSAQTSGQPLKFTEEGEREGGNPVLVRVVPARNGITCGFEVCFQQILGIILPNT